jgi:WSC domain
MARLMLMALAIMGALTAGSVLSQTPSPVPRNTYIAPKPLPFVPRPNGAFACFVDSGPALTIYSPLPNPAGHDLSGQVTWSMRQTNDQCRATCANQNFLYSGTQSGAFCFCGNTAGTLSAPNTGQPFGTCGSPCTGSPGEVCGGASTNSVSLTGALGLVPPQILPLPANGGQCVINLAGPGYRDVEVQRWEVTGPPTMGTNGLLYPMQWTVNGGGRSVQVTTAGTDTTILVRAWTMTGSSPVNYIAIIRAGDGALLFHETSTSVSGSLSEKAQQQFLDGVPQKSSMGPPGPWPEYLNPLLLTMPNATVISSTQTTAVDPMTAVPNAYARLPGTSGTISCSWNVIR